MKTVKARNTLGKPTLFEYWKWLTIPVLLYVFVVVVPIVVGLVFSFTNWGGGKKVNFIGFNNYAQLLQDKNFWTSFLNNLYLVVMCLIGQTLGGLLIAILLSTKFLKLRAIYRFVIFLPNILSGVVVGYLWQIVYNNQFGLLNWFLEAIGKPEAVRMWLDDPKIVMTSISIMLIWQFIGLNVVIFLSSIQNIPQDILESAEMDGATGWQKAIHITMPLLRGTIKVTALLCITGNMKIFDHIWLMTRGGPGISSSVLSVYTYKVSFDGMKFGYGAASSIGVMLLSAILLITFNLFTRRWKNDD